MKVKQSRSLRKRVTTPAAAATAGAAAEVRKCREGQGYGLFAKAPLGKSVVVTSVRARDAGPGLRALQGKPGGDAAISVGTCLLTSSGFGSPDADGRYSRAPKWYRMNHSYRPNVKLTFSEGQLTWKTLRDVPKGEALTWHYGIADPEWHKARPYCTHSA